MEHGFGSQHSSFVQEGLGTASSNRSCLLPVADTSTVVLVLRLGKVKKPSALPSRTPSPFFRKPLRLDKDAKPKQMPRSYGYITCAHQYGAQREAGANELATDAKPDAFNSIALSF